MFWNIALRRRRAWVSRWDGLGRQVEERLRWIDSTLLKGSDGDSTDRRFGRQADHDVTGTVTMIITSHGWDIAGRVARPRTQARYRVQQTEQDEQLIWRPSTVDGGERAEGERVHWLGRASACFEKAH
jgi:hypothetical protein